MPRGTSSRRRLPAISVELLPQLRQFSEDLQNLTADSNTDVHPVADSLLEILASERCNETAKNALLGSLATFLETNASSAYEVARRVTASDRPAAGSSRTYKETAYAYKREIVSLESSLEDLRIDNRALAKRGQDLSSRLTATREELARADEKLSRARHEQRMSNGLTYKRWIQLASNSKANREELGRVRIELKQAHEKARLNEAKYRNLNVEVNGAIDTLTRSSEPLRHSIARSNYGW
ncbi:hypothetical protein PENSPDRAFT_651523 [Peniophora sp. CONT]|nr:hypothetical protein PENSPDRAFT_651523 [Peniophora sp. CONT]